MCPERSTEKQRHVQVCEADKLSDAEVEALRQQNPRYVKRVRMAELCRTGRIIGVDADLFFEIDDTEAPYSCVSPYVRFNPLESIKEAGKLARADT